MTDQSVIRKAVELADGWEITWEKMRPSDFTHIQMPGGSSGPVFYLEDHAKPQWALDALAAQLVRQVDGTYHKAKDSNIYVMITEDETEVYGRFRKGLSGSHDIASAHGPDRTMNTLKAIVQSGVLDG